MPFYKDAMSHGNLHVEFTVEFPKKGEVKNPEELKKILPVPKNLPETIDRKKCEIMMDFDKGSTNDRADGGKNKGGRGHGHGDDDDDEEGGPQGQRVQCQQQ